METTQLQAERSRWEVVTALGLVAAACGPLLTMALDQRFAAFGLIFVVLPLIVAGLALTRNRWLMIVVVVLSALYLFSAVQAAPVQYRLAHPEATGYFVVVLMQVIGSAVATGAGLVALVQSLVARQPRSANRA